ncbi:MAG TPA: hypothetical protein VF252_00145 [Gemmatimonadales bacterium]
MSIHTPEGRARAGERFEYFMVRVTRFEDDPDRVSGMIERLGSGEKQSFDTGEHLVQLVGAWSRDLNMTPGTDDRNAVRSGTDGSATPTGV